MLKYRQKNGNIWDVSTSRQNKVGKEKRIRIFDCWGNPWEYIREKENTRSLMKKHGKIRSLKKIPIKFLSPSPKNYMPATLDSHFCPPIRSPFSQCNFYSVLSTKNNTCGRVESQIDTSFLLLVFVLLLFPIQSINGPEERNIPVTIISVVTDCP